MSRSQLRFIRLVSAILTLTLTLTTLLSIPPGRADARGRGDTLFRAEFESAPAGPLSGRLAVEDGAVVPQGGSVAVATALVGRALALDGTSGQATALLQWNNYPGGLPIEGTVPVSTTAPVSSTQEVNIRISGDFTTALSGTAGGSFGLLSGASFFEFFSFGANDTLTRAGATIGRYTRGQPVHLDARIRLKGATGEVRITLVGGSSATIKVPLTGAFNVATLNQLRLQVPAGAALVTADHLCVKIEDEEKGDDDPPAVIIIKDGDIEQEIENVGGIVFVSVKITIVNTGGKAKGAFLVLDLDDLKELLDLDDVSFLAGIGFVSQINEHQILIGLGQNNIIYNGGKIQVKIKFKAKHGGLDIKVNAKFKLRFHDTGGDQEIALPPVVVVVPVVVAPGLTPTQPITPTNDITPTAGITPTTVVRLPITAIDVRFQATWRIRGGLDIFGLPLSGPITLSNGMVVQYFERARFEFHPELRATQYEVLLGLLGVELGYAMPAVVAPADAADLWWYFKETGHTIARPFRSFWQGRGGLALFGLPIGEPVMENGLLVQYFERERMELHPELAGTRYQVQLGHLGVAALEAANR